MAKSFEQLFKQASDSYPLSLPVAAIPPFSIAGELEGEGKVLTIVNGIAAWDDLPPFDLPVDFVVDVAHGGTGLSSYTVGDLIVAVQPDELSVIHDIVTDRPLFSTGVGVIPAYRRITAADVDSGTFPGPTKYTFSSNVVISSELSASLIAVGATGPLRIKTSDNFGAFFEAPLIGVARFGIGSVAPGFAGLKAGGTSSVPTPITNAAVIVQLSAFGYTGTTYAFGGNITINGTETWTDLRNGTNASVFLTRRFTTSQVEVMSIYPESVIIAPWSIWTSATAVSNTLDGFMIIDTAGTPGSGTFGAGIGFSRLGETGLNFGTWKRMASIIPRQVTAVSSQIGIAIWVHDSATVTDAQVQAWQWNVAGDVNAKAFGHIIVNTDNTQDLGESAIRWRSGYFGTEIVVGTSVTVGSRLSASTISSADTGSSFIYTVGNAVITTTSPAPNFIFRRAAGTIAIPTYTPAASNIGTLIFQGYDENTAAYQSSAFIIAITDTIWSATNRGTYLLFATTATGSTTTTNRWSIEGLGAFKPQADNSYDIGISVTHRVRAGYFRHIVINETGGAALDMFGAVSDGQYLKRSGTDIIGDTLTVDDVSGLLAPLPADFLLMGG